MKSTLVALFTLGLSMAVHAQPVVDGSGFTDASSNLTYLNAAPLWQPPFDLLGSGENLTWNLEDFTAFTETNEDFFAMSSLGIAYTLQFALAGNPDASPTHVKELVQLDDVEVPLPVEFSDVYEFYQNDAQGYSQVGISFSITDFPLVTVYTDIDRIYNWPLQYDDRDTSFSSFTVSLANFGAYGTSGFRFNHVDAWGNMITPDGSFDVLRVRSELLLTDTVNFPALELAEMIERPLQVDYKWISPQLDGELLRITTVGEQVLAAQLQSLSTVSVADVQATSDLKVWPNPSRSACSISLPAKMGTLEVFDMSGRRMVQESQLSSDIFSLQTGLWPGGLYLVRYVDPKGEAYSAKILHLD